MKNKYSLICNILIVIMVTFSLIVMYTGISFMGPSLILSSSKLAMFKYFTVDSNILMGLTSLILIIYLIKGKSIPKWLYSLKLISTVGVTLTFLTVILYLGPTSKYGFLSMFLNANLFLHLLIPLLSIITFILFEHTSSLTIKDVFIGTTGMIIYAIYYITNILTHLDNGHVPIKYDWYYFAQGGIIGMTISLIIMLLSTLLISYLLWKLNQKVEK